ncbi:HTH domain-containing protein [Clostridium sartagoforme]|uniref:HTH domain-containing protein n=1 Tax=Clostridium sartagoforme TaxID=84031 RepID=UPI00039FD9EE|nr:HTH domain-containing protein [Clostridium sartagoforme]
MRELNIINDLIEANGYLTIEYFIDKYSVSKRTLQNDFSYLTNISLEKGFILMKKRGKGYLIEITNEEKLKSFIKDLNRMDSKPKVTVENISAYIALKESYITIEEIVEEFNSSKSLINKFKVDVDNYLKEYNLTVERKAHYGVKINEALEKRKDLITNLYLKENEVIRKYINKIIGQEFTYIKKH